MKRIRKQINNLSIRQARKKWLVIAPNKVTLKEFDTIEEAEDYAKNNIEFKHKKKERIKVSTKKEKTKRANLNDINELCDFINELQKLAPSQVGSIEYYHSMTENAIVQICNEVRGHRVLRYGTEKELKQYLLDVLNNITVTIEI